MVWHCIGQSLAHFYLYDIIYHFLIFHSQRISHCGVWCRLCGRAVRRVITECDKSRRLASVFRAIVMACLKTATQKPANAKWVVIISYCLHFSVSSGKCTQMLFNTECNNRLIHVLQRSLSVRHLNYRRCKNHSWAVLERDVIRINESLEYTAVINERLTIFPIFRVHWLSVNAAVWWPLGVLLHTNYRFQVVVSSRNTVS